MTTMTRSRPSRAKALETLVPSTGDLFVSLSGDGSASVTGLAFDSRAVSHGDLFFCLPGANVDGHDFAGSAVASGAAALCVERPTGAGAPELIVTDVRAAMARLATAFLDRPADDLLLLGVTGTNGKTTTAFLLESILAAAGRTTGLIGTIETRLAGHTRSGVRTTPEPVDLQYLFDDMRAAGVDAVAMEVTSHALVLRRVDGIRFRCAAFTNLSQDHLDFHSGMDDYFAAKRSLFTSARCEAAAINRDDVYGRRLLESISVPAVSFGTSADAHVRAVDVRAAHWRNEFVIVVDGPDLPRAELDISTPLVGGFNVSNCLAAAASALAAGIGPDAVAAGIQDLAAVPGRFENIDEGQEFAVVVDYSHTPDSLDNALHEALLLARAHGGRVLIVFGCGGDRDRSKRPLMGAVAGRLADVVIVTSDNPRSEDPIAIIDQILEGVVAERAAGPDAVIPDRRDAIAHAIGQARPGDVVLIAGKGHETGQEFADRTLPFDDREVARSLVRERDAA
jgi:UDP-N-acetylmuramoyl-L-alanyl-D-glutamate--2,6-diaminopimelate ligase